MSQMVRVLAIASRNWQTRGVDAETLHQSLSRVHPRTLQVLLARFVAPTAELVREGAVTQVHERAGRSFDQFAAFYGVAPAAAKVLLWRAVREFDAVVRGQPAPAPLPFELEARAAEALHAALESPLPPPSQELASLVEPLRALTTHAPALRERLAAAERAELDSPAYARETWLRRLAIVLVLALSAWFYWKADLTRLWQRWGPAVSATSDAGG
ncbi:MAG: hypothetical protein JNJ54_01970 [Myxococcaceae bacterium]|nr:hypothetical protein [Myxococcaceae bacterium]